MRAAETAEAFAVEVYVSFAHRASAIERSPRVESNAFENHLRDGVNARMRKRQVGNACARTRENLSRLSVKNYGGLAGAPAHDFNVVPADFADPTRLQSFQRGLFRREARGVVLSRCGSATVAVGALAFSKHALAEARRAFEDLAHALYFDNVYADGDDHGRD